MQSNLTSWGGGVLFDGQHYHLFVCVMTNSCPLSAWRQNSRIDHAVAHEITGPYVFQDVAIRTWSHNPAPVRLADGTFAIFHIGEGSGSAEGGMKCKAGGSTSSLEETKVFVIDYATNWADKAFANFIAFCDTNGIDPTDWDMKALDKYGRAVEGPESVVREQFPLSIVVTKKVQPGSTIHTSRSLSGPWEPLLPNTLGNCNNPAPWVHSNGTIFIVCGSSMQLKRAEHISGPWHIVTSFSHLGGPVGNYEDPYLYIDKRGFHIIYHVYNTAQREECVTATVSAHAFSKDGFSWHLSSMQPFTSQIEVEAFGTMIVSTRERPFLFFNAAGQMTHLISAVCSASRCPSEASCVNCKYTHWDYTLIQPFDLSVASPASSSPRLSDLDCTKSIAGHCSSLHIKMLASYQGTLRIL